MAGKLSIILILVIFLFTHCRKNENIPKNIIQPDKMVNILIDLHIAEAKIKILSKSRIDSSTIYFTKLRNKTYNKYDINHTKFDSSYTFYMKKRQETMKEIYTQVVDSLSLRKATINAKPSKK